MPAREGVAPVRTRLIPAQRQPREGMPAESPRTADRAGTPGATGVLGAMDTVGSESADPVDTFALIDALLDRVRRHRPADTFDALARHRLLERRELLERQAERRPPRGGSVGWVHGDFHPFNVLYRDDVPDVPAAILDWDRLGVQPRAEEAVRAAVIFFVRPVGALDLASTVLRARVPAFRGRRPGRTLGRRAPRVVGAAQRLLDAALALRARRHPRRPTVPRGFGVGGVVDAGVRRGVRGVRGVTRGGSLRPPGITPRRRRHRPADRRCPRCRRRQGSRSPGSPAPPRESAPPSSAPPSSARPSGSASGTG